MARLISAAVSHNCGISSLCSPADVNWVVLHDRDRAAITFPVASRIGAAAERRPNSSS
jgi:hypothetical protein